MKYFLFFIIITFRPTFFPTQNYSFVSICAMRFIIRHLTPLFRSRRRFSFLLIISLFICLLFIFYKTNHDTESFDISSVLTDHRDDVNTRTIDVIRK